LSACFPSTGLSFSLPLPARLCDPVGLDVFSVCVRVGGVGRGGWAGGWMGVCTGIDVSGREHAVLMEMVVVVVEEEEEEEEDLFKADTVSWRRA